MTEVGVVLEIEKDSSVYANRQQCGARFKSCLLDAAGGTMASGVTVLFMGFLFTVQRMIVVGSVLACFGFLCWVSAQLIYCVCRTMVAKVDVTPVDKTGDSTLSPVLQTMTLEQPSPRAMFIRGG